MRKIILFVALLSIIFSAQSQEISRYEIQYYGRTYIKRFYRTFGGDVSVSIVEKTREEAYESNQYFKKRNEYLRTPKGELNWIDLHTKIRLVSSDNDVKNAIRWVFTDGEIIKMGSEGCSIYMDFSAKTKRLIHYKLLFTGNGKGLNNVSDQKLVELYTAIESKIKFSLPDDPDIPVYECSSNLYFRTLRNSRSLLDPVFYRTED